MDRIVTLINKENYRAFVAKLIRKGPKYYKVSPLPFGTPRLLPVYDFILLEGKRQDVVERFREVLREYDRTRQEHLKAREVALCYFREAWDKKYPFPASRAIEEILKEFTKEGGDDIA